MFIFRSIRILIRAASRFVEDGVTSMGAALAYYALFSLAPLLILAVLFAGWFYGEEAARERVQEHLQQVLGPGTTEEVLTLMDATMKPDFTSLPAILGSATLLLGALGAFLHIRQCLCVIWKLDPPNGNSFLGTILNYLLSIVMVLCVGLLLVLSLILSTAATIMHRLTKETPAATHFWSLAEAGTSFVLLSVFFGIVFRVMSGRRISWFYVVYGSLVTALLFTLGKMLISWYLVYTSTASAYGAASSLVVLLIWVYYSSQIFFFGAELIQARRTYSDWA
jgi:membrane protein